MQLLLCDTALAYARVNQYNKGAMVILENVPLASYSTMRVGGSARYLVDITEEQQIPSIVQFANDKSLPIIMIGGGSNIIWNDDGYNGIVLVNKLTGYQEDSFDEHTAYVHVASGENWDDTVRRTVESGLSGLEALSLIPGSVGGTPVQNVGAYGKEIKDVLVTLKAYDIAQKTFVVLPNSECNFGYRTSRFKTKDKGRFLITSVSFQLSRSNPSPPFYRAVSEYLHQHHTGAPVTAKDIRNAVITIRRAKLPDPAVVPNCGSFFQNPIISNQKLQNIQLQYPDIPYWNADSTHAKISAAWLIQESGYKAFHDKETGMGTWASQPLVFINESAHSARQIMAFRDKIISEVEKKFGITLMQEPEIIVPTYI
jgi:UDP-N-acetylmuramate dehydrogenase